MLMWSILNIEIVFHSVCQVNQTQSNPLGSGLGYLEHICQLIEKIGQLQEHNLKLQKQICILQKDGKMKKTKVVDPIFSLYLQCLF